MSNPWLTPRFDGEYMVEIPDTVIVRQAIALALEYGDNDIPETIGVGEHGQHNVELHWSIKDINPDDCDVEVVEKDGHTTVVVHGEIEATYDKKVRSATYNPPGAAHPAEYETCYVPLMVSIEYDLQAMNGLGEATAYGEIA